MTLDYSPFDERYRADPYPVYRRLRDESPVHWTPDPGAWVVSRFEDVARVLRRTDEFSSDAMSTVLMGASPRAVVDPASDPDAARRALAIAQALPFDLAEMRERPGGGVLINADPPHHDAMRRIVNRGFTPRRISAWEPRLRALVDECMAKVREGTGFDVIRDLAVPVPTILISEMLGVEPGRRDDFKRWSDGIVAATSGSRRSAGFFEGGILDVVHEFAAYFAEVAERRRRDPKDDLVSVLVDAEEDEALSSMEMVFFALLLLVAGNETTTNLIGNAVRALYAHPETLGRAARDPGAIPGLIEETLRYDGPVQLLFRRATRELELSGVRISADQFVVPILGSANRDPRQWGPDAEAFDIDRDTQGHLAFGFGIHFCLGASLARLEARCALEALAPELPRFAPAEGGVELIDSFQLRGPRRLPLLPR